MDTDDLRVPAARQDSRLLPDCPPASGLWNGGSSYPGEMSVPIRTLGLRRPGKAPWHSGRDPQSVGRLVLSPDRVRPWSRLFAPRLALVSDDTDPDLGVAAIWVAHSPVDHQRERTQAGNIWLYEYLGGGWRWVAGSECAVPSSDLTRGREPAGREGQIGMMDVFGSCGSISFADRRRGLAGHDMSEAAWVGCTLLRVAAEVDHLSIGARRATVPHHGCAAVAWKAPIARPLPGRPTITAVGPDGTSLSVLGPVDQLDSFTWAHLDDAADPSPEDTTTDPG